MYSNINSYAQEDKIRSKMQLTVVKRKLIKTICPVDPLVCHSLIKKERTDSLVPQRLSEGCSWVVQEH